MAHERQTTTPPTKWTPRPALPHELIPTDRATVERDLRAWEANEGSTHAGERFAETRGVMPPFQLVPFIVGLLDWLVLHPLAFVLLASVACVVAFRLAFYSGLRIAQLDRHEMQDTEPRSTVVPIAAARERRRLSAIVEITRTRKDVA